MKISIAIPQYNRVEFLLKNLERLSAQTYPNIEVVISDDASSDDTEARIRALIGHYRYPLVYFRHSQNVGYDANLRKSMELCSGDYCFILGNDDSLNATDDIAHLVNFLETNQRPEIGFCNFVEEADLSQVNRRAAQTAVLGAGPDLALKYHKSFSFVAGLIFRRDVFLQANTACFDGSIYVQIYLATLIIARGGRLFTLERPMVLKDLQIGGERANSYREKLARQWRDLRPTDSGLPQVVRVAVAGLRDAGFDAGTYAAAVVKKIYTQTYPFWLLDFRRNGAFVAACGLCWGLQPGKFAALGLSWFNTLKIWVYYGVFTTIGLFTPLFLFNRFQHKIYALLKK